LPEVTLPSAPLNPAWAFAFVVVKLIRPALKVAKARNGPAFVWNFGPNRAVKGRRFV